MSKKEKIWTIGNKGPTGPWVWHTWIKGSKKPVRVVAFDVDHIRCQLAGKQVIKVKRLPEEKNEFSSIPLGPKGCTVNQPADYDKGFKILKAWLDTQEGPPESVRQELRELFIDYDRAKSKTTRYSARKKLRHKI